MDPYNPIIAETHVERVSVWALLGDLLLAASAAIVGVWCIAVLILSLERVAP